MLRYRKPTRIELKKSDLDDFEQKRTEALAKKQELAVNDQSSDAVLPASPKFRQAEIRRRLGFTPDVVSSDGPTNIQY